MTQPPSKPQSTKPNPQKNPSEQLKAELLNLFFDDLERELKTIAEAAFAAREAAVSEEAKAENKYDTRGLEASYLAGAQAKRASELREVITKLRKNEIRLYSENERIEGLALVAVVSEGGETKNFFIVPSEGGVKLEHKGQIYFLVTPESPIGQSLWQQKVGDEFEFRVKGELQFFEIVSVV